MDFKNYNELLDYINTNLHTYPFLNKDNSNFIYCLYTQQIRFPKVSIQNSIILTWGNDKDKLVITLMDNLMSYYVYRDHKVIQKWFKNTKEIGLTTFKAIKERTK